MDPAGMHTGWYFIEPATGAQVGPLSWEELYAARLSGSLGPHDLVWNADLPDWSPASGIPGLFAPPPPTPTGLRSAPAQAQPQYMPRHEWVPEPTRSAPARRSWLLAILIPLVAIIIVGGGLGSYFAFWHNGAETVTESTLGGTAATRTTESADRGLGRAETVDPDPSTVVESATLGYAPANQVLVMMAEGKGREDAERVAEQIGGEVVGEMEYISLYQIQTGGTTAQDLETAVAAAGAAPGVDVAFPNSVTELKAPIEGKKCSPMRDPMYEAGDNAAAYEMIGMQEALDILKATKTTFNDVHVGVVDSQVYTKSGHDFTPELNFPDKNGKYVPGKPKVRGLDANAATDQPETDPGSGGLTHATQVGHIIGADPGSGASGVAGSLQDKLTMTFTNATKGGLGAWPAPNPDVNDVTQYKGYFSRDLIEIQKQIDAGATVINLSLGPKEPSAKNAWNAAAYKRFFEKMAKDKPGVVFVAAAGNENGALDGSNYGPGGFKLPNVITVGALDNSGDRATAGDWYDPALIKQAYEDRKAAGTIPANQTLEQFTNGLQAGSNYATGNGEVTISACGSNVPTGLDPEGRPVLSSGTSFATPQVTAAIALLKSINPKLSAQQIKDILVSTASSEVDRDGTKTAVPADVGGKVLRVDNAVLKVINDLRGPGNELTKDDLLALASVNLVADGGPTDYTVTASITKVNPGGTDLTISMSGEGMISGDSSQHLDGPGEVSWTVSPKEGNTPTIRVVRSDTGGCAILVLETIDINGRWEGTFTFTQFESDQPLPTGGDTGSGGDSGLEGCDLSFVGAIIAELLGKPLPMTMDITVDEQGNGTGVMYLDTSAVVAAIQAQYPDMEISGSNEPQTLTFIYQGNTLHFQTQGDMSTGTMTATVERRGDALVMDGSLSSSQDGFLAYATWSCTKQ